MNLIRFFKNKIKKKRFIFWSFFHPDNIFKFKYSNKAEMIAWEFVKNKLSNYNSLCEIGCFNGRIIIILREFLKNKKYVGFDLNIFAILIAKTLNYIIWKNKYSFHWQNGSFSAYQDSELLISIATLIYFSEKELKRFISLLKLNKTLKAVLIHEIFINEKFVNNKSTLIDNNLNIHSISMIKKEFGENYNFEIHRTYYSNWESEDRISAILCIKRI